jgi:hypothetical protein
MRSFASPLLIAGAIVGASIAGAGTQASSAHVIVAPQIRPVAPQYRVQNPYSVKFDAKCKTSGGVSVSPCPVVLTMSNPAQNVTVTAPASTTITEKDDCTVGSNTIATVVGSGTTYVVASGNTTGKCKAKFIARDANGNKVGKAVLPITNKFAT